MSSNRKTIVLHILGCLIFLALPVALSPHPPEELGFLTSPPTIRDFLANAFMLAFFYLNFYILIPKLYFNRKFVLYSFWVILFFLIICLLPALLTGRNPFDSDNNMMTQISNNVRPPQIPSLPEGSSFLTEIKHHIYLFVAVILFSILLRIRSRLLDLEQAKHNSEIIVLKDQINPHFLFNTLNGLYGLAVRDKSTTTATGILKLSGMMRYVVTESRSETVSLEKEISYVNDYIELQKLRLDKQVQLSYRAIGYMSNQMIAPLTLIPFIENAFKHGVNPDEDSSINILIEVEEKQLRLTVENNKVRVALGPHEKSGKGIMDTKARLQLIYPLRHSLLFSEDEKTYRVQLTIQL